MNRGWWLAGLLIFLGGMFWLGASLVAAQGSATVRAPTKLYLPAIRNDATPARPAGITPTPTPIFTPAPTRVAPAPTLAMGNQVYALVGRLERQPDRHYAYILEVSEVVRYPLLAETPAVELNLAELARAAVPPLVKIWGRVLPPDRPDDAPLIVVSAVLAAETDADPTVASVPMATAKFARVNLHAGPSASYANVGEVRLGQVCEITGRNPLFSWYQLTCATGQQGWIDARLVTVTGDTSRVPVIDTVIAVPTETPTPTPTARPTATPTPVLQTWRAEFFGNTRLAGAPVAAADVAQLDFNWGTGGPSQTGSDNFSARFTRRITVTPGYYLFTAEADDGIRMWVDGRLILDAWPAVIGRVYTVGQVLTGSHDLRVEYYEAGGQARVRVDYGPAAETAAAWRAAYYYGVDPNGAPAFQQPEPRGTSPLDYDWGSGSPDAAVLGTDYFSARWTGQFVFDGGNYAFHAQVDDGVRVWIDGLLVLDYWRDGYKDVRNRVIGIGSGSHTITVEYYERTGSAQIKLWWYRDSAYTGPQ